MAGISTSPIVNKYINVNILNKIAARFTESTEKCLKTHETAADDDANSEGQHEFASFLYKENPVFDTGFNERYAFDHKSSTC